MAEVSNKLRCYGFCSSEKAAEQNASVPKPKKFFKSRDSGSQESTPAIYNETTKPYGSTTKRPKLSTSSDSEPSNKSPPIEPSRKFFVSKTGNSKDSKTVLTSNSLNNVKRDDTKPPIVLRICRGKSQLLSDSEESETTVTPTSTPSTSAVTSPRSTSQKSPGSIRVTRSTRRSMQQDPSSSPATADTPADTFGSLIFSPKKDIDLSPQYIPAEKYEQERKAMYASLLGTTEPVFEQHYPLSETNQVELNGLECKEKENLVPVSNESKNSEQANDSFESNTEIKFVSNDANVDLVPMELETEDNAPHTEESTDNAKQAAIPKISIIVKSGEIRTRRQKEAGLSEHKTFEIKLKDKGVDDNYSQDDDISKEIDVPKEENDSPNTVIETKTYEKRQRKPKDEKEEETVKTYLRTRKQKEKKDVELELPEKKLKDEKDEETKTYEMRTRKQKEEKEETTAVNETIPATATTTRTYTRTRRQKEVNPKDEITFQPEETKTYETRIRRQKDEVKEDHANTVSKEDKNEAKPKKQKEDKDEVNEFTFSDDPAQSTDKEENASQIKEKGEESKSAPSVEEIKSSIYERRLTRNALRSKTSSDECKSPEKSTDDSQAPVKIVISKKKGSIFKSRSMVTTDAGKKRRALYKHKWSDDSKETASKTEEEGTPKSKEDTAASGFEFEDGPLVRLPNNNGDGDIDRATTVKCTKNDKGFYTVVRNVKKAHQIQEIGEFQEFNDDVEYILDALQDNNPISTRCLSAITLASKCMVPAFRMHVRAHGTVAKFFKALHDATKDQSLGLCTATVMFVLSQDRLNMDLDRDCLELMLNLLESDVSYQQALDVCGLSSAQLEKNKQKVKELCSEIQSQGHAKHLNLDNITVGQLAMETLLSLTSKRAGEWFKEELRELGGLEHIIKTIYECCRQVSDYVVTWTDALLDKLRKIDRCMRVLENVTYDNEENQVYILKYKDGMILETLVQLYRLCDSEIPLYPVTDVSDKESTGSIIREALLVTLKVLINLTHHFNSNSFGGALIGSQPGIIEASLHLLLQVPHYIPDQKKFELGVLVLMLLINLIQDNDANKKLLVEAKAPAEFESAYACDKSAVEALIAQFYQWEECARVAEKRTDAILDGEKDGETQNVQKSNEEFIEETVAKLLQKAGIHMEFTFLASYIVMLMGFLIMNNSEYETIVRTFLKDNNFSTMVDLLNKFFKFMNLTASSGASSVCAMKATEKVLKYLEDCDRLQEEKTKVDKENTTTSSECMDLSYSVVH
ncbi:wings apart-like protein homolog isoform X2 [Agrilus planipennis]|uniref:Wings apart-like protein homolog isoform X2 n=1 Tax=Agrilus planipennis TaxID=224129 RepID=A0A1W4X844_AGRPL|nr:wings apart-like protein homolog isoform X2 [Agrilus planipennis]